MGEDDDVQFAAAITLAACGCDGGLVTVRLHDAQGRIFAVGQLPVTEARSLQSDLATAIGEAERGVLRIGTVAGHG